MLEVFDPLLIFKTLLKEIGGAETFLKNSVFDIPPTKMHGEEFCTQIKINLTNSASLEVFTQKSHKIIQAISCIPFKVNFMHNGKIVGAKSEDVQFLKEYQQGALAMITTQERDVAVESKDLNEPELIDLSQIGEPLQGLLRKQIASLRLPVYMQENGGLGVPQTTFDSAWYGVGQFIKGNIEFDLAPQPEQVSEAKDSQNESPKQKRRVIMYPSLKSAEISVGEKPSDISRTIDVVLERVNNSLFPTEGATLDAIANQTELGQALCGKIHDCFKKSDEKYKQVEAWTKILKKMITECNKRLKEKS